MAKQSKKKIFNWGNFSIISLVTFGLAIISFAFLFLSAYQSTSSTFYNLMFGTGIIPFNKPVITLIVVWAITVLATIATPFFGIVCRNKYYPCVIGLIYVIFAIFLFCSTPIARAEGIDVTYYMGNPVASITGGVFFILTGALMFALFTYLYLSEKKKA